jgi:hypothetical protein
MSFPHLCRTYRSGPAFISSTRITRITRKGLQSSTPSPTFAGPIGVGLHLYQVQKLRGLQGKAFSQVHLPLPLQDLSEWACIYIKYIQILRKLETAYDQMVQPQKRLDMRKALEACIGGCVQLLVSACACVVVSLRQCEHERANLYIHICRVGQNRIYTPYMTVCMVISLPK